MGNSASIQSKMKQDSILQTFFKSKRLRFIFRMKATRDEYFKLDNEWTNFLVGDSKEFKYETACKYPQLMRIYRKDEKIYLSVENTIEILEEDVKQLTDMFQSLKAPIWNATGCQMMGLMNPSPSQTNLLSI